MSSSIFWSALGRALSRNPLSSLTLSRLSSTCTSTTSQDEKKPHQKVLSAESSRQNSTKTTRQPAHTNSIRPSPLSTRHGRKIPKLLLTLRDLGLAKDVPGPVRGKRNLAHTDPQSPKKRFIRRNEDKEWLQKHGKEFLWEHLSKRKSQLNYYEQVRRHKLNLAHLQMNPAIRKTAYFHRGKRHDEDLSLSSITREYIEAVSWFTQCTFSPFNKRQSELRIHTGLDPDIIVITKVFTYKNRWFLSSKGYDPWDVVVWGWILTAKDAEQAGLRMKLYQSGLPTTSLRATKHASSQVDNSKNENSPGEQKKECLQAEQEKNSPNGVNRASIDFDKDDNSSSLSRNHTSPVSPPKTFPVFLILLTLRRKPLSRMTLSYMLSIGQDLLTQLGTDYKTKILFIIRLLRRIQEENILALPYFAQLIITHLDLTPTSSPKSVQHRTFIYNRLLSLMARPSHERPFQYHPIIQQSQFMLLRSMSAMNILVTREGYRAIISVQLARAKTTEERDRIRGMKMSWPPWQEEKDAWSDKFERGKVTRAGVVLRQMQEAGYAFQEWEYAASILAGEDTDRTPTIPTRSYLRLPPSGVIAKGRAKLEARYRQQPKNESTEDPKAGITRQEWGPSQRPHAQENRREALIWSARIRATRTLEEAWSVFLSAREVIGKPTPNMYQELFEKVVAAERLQGENEGNGKHSISVPGAETVLDSTISNPLQAEDPSTMEFLLTLPKKLTPEQRLVALRNHANELRLKQLQEERNRPGKPVSGEGREVLPAPFSPSDGGVHVPVPPPTLANLYHMMQQDGFQPKLDTILLLVEKARDQDTADRLLGERVVQEIWRGFEDDSPRNTQFKKPNWRILTAYLQALVNCGYIQRAVRLLIITSVRKHDPTWRYLPAWNVILKALVDWKFRVFPMSWKRARDVVESNVEKRKGWLQLVWKLYVYMRDLRLEIDGATLMSLCTAARKAMQLEEDVRKGTGDKNALEILWDGKKPWEQVVGIFRILVGNVQSQWEREAELNALRAELNQFQHQQEQLALQEHQDGKETEEEAEKISAPFWVEFEESDSLDHNPNHSKNPTNTFPDLSSLDSSIDPAYYPPHPTPPPPPPPPPLPSPSASLPKTNLYIPPLYTPSFAILHAYFRLLGLAEQKDEIILTLNWMVRVACGEEKKGGQGASSWSRGNGAGINLPMKGTDEVGTTVGEKRRARTCLVAVRAFLDSGAGEWLDVAEMIVDGKKMKERGDEHGTESGKGKEKLWGGWPSKDEVEEYKRGNALSPMKRYYEN